MKSKTQEKKEKEFLKDLMWIATMGRMHLARETFQKWKNRLK